LEKHLLPDLLSSNAEELRSRPLEALKAAVNRAEEDITRSFGAAGCNAGSTLLAALLIDDKLHIANVGDSRAVLVKGSDAKQLTRDHTPTCSIEQQRIKADDPAADISADGYLYGELAVARDIGSAHLKRDPARRALVATADLTTVQLTQEDDFIVLGSDGLWDRVGNADMGRVARRSLATGSKDAVGAAKALVEHGQRCGSSDNISVATLLLHDRAISLLKSNSMLFSRRPLAGPVSADSPVCSTPSS
jgi:protein phosphatase 2C family protein 2/3